MCDHAALSAQAFDTLADTYQAQFMDLDLYDDTYRAFCDRLAPGARVLDAACGPGNVARFVLAYRPDLNLLGLDLAPRMVALAREAVPAAQFIVHDCRQLQALQRHFDGIVCAFGLPYLTPQEVKDWLLCAADVLEPGGMLYFSTLLGPADAGGRQRCSTGASVYLHYHAEADLQAALQRAGFATVMQHVLASPSTARQATTDLIVLAQRL